jgi:5'(3')-deoxyribonucleotidase
MKIFVDLDGVLVNFDGGFEEAFGQSPKRTFAELGDDYTWHLIDQIPNFWLEMDPMPDADVLWEYIKSYNPTVLTKPAKSVHNCKKEKREWVDKYLGEDIEVLFASNKARYATEDSILIDDKEENIESWKSAGGIGILHNNANDTIKQLDNILNKGKAAMESESIVEKLIKDMIPNIFNKEDLLEILVELDENNDLAPEVSKLTDNYIDYVRHELATKNLIELGNLVLVFLEDKEAPEKLAILSEYFPEELNLQTVIQDYVEYNFNTVEEQMDAYKAIADELETKD